MNNAFDYCKTPENVGHKEMLNAIHEAFCQLGRAAGESYVDNRPALLSLSKCLEKAGHIGFTK